MKIMKLLCVLFFLFLGILAEAQTITDKYQDGKIYLKFKDSQPINFIVNPDNTVDKKTVPFISELSSEYSITGLSRPFFLNNDGKLLRTLMLEISEFEKIDNLINRLKLEPSLEYVEKVPLDVIDYTPNDSLYTLYNGPQNWNWHLELIQAEQAWNITRGSADIAVGIVDNAVWVNHPDLTDKIIAQRDVVYGTNNANPPTNGNKSDWSHGTHVAGLVGASSDNNIGISSIGFNVSIIAVKASNNSNPRSISSGYQGIQWAANNGADVINMSWGGTGFSQTNQNLINTVSNMGVVLVAAAGNDNISTPHYPSAYQNVISIASIDYNDQKSYFSNFSTTVDLSSPGGISSPGPDGVLSSVWNETSLGNYEAYIGTSMASPVAAGLAALVLSVNPELTPAQVEEIMESTSDNISAQNPSYNGMLGAGRINAFRAVSNTPFTPVAAFSTAVQSILPSTTINFTSEAAGIPTTWQWNFEGGIPAASNDTNPSNILYQTAGSYDVTLTVTNAFGTHTATYPDYITVTASPVPYISISISDSIPCIAQTVSIIDNSLYSPTTWLWDIQPANFIFVNGTSATSQNPQVEFLRQGLYNISCTATNQYGQSTASYNNAVNVRGIAPTCTLDFEDGTSQYFTLWDTTKSQSAIHLRAAYNSTRGIHFHGDPIPTGWKGSPTDATPEEVWSQNLIFQSEARLCGVDARAFTDGVKMSLDLRQTYSLGNKYSWFRVLVNGTPIADYNGVTDFNPVSAGDDPWQKIEFDLTPYAGQVFDVTLQACNRFSDKVQGQGDNVFIDNVEITSSLSASHIMIDKGISVFPNPVKDIINLKIADLTKNSTYEIINSNGKVVLHGTLSTENNLVTINSKNLVTGVYIVRVVSEGNNVMTAKFVK